MAERFSLANKRHLSIVVALLFASGSMCPKCGHGTRATSKRWAKCKRCGERVERKPLDDCITLTPRAAGGTDGD